jgi:hypothetical protein
MKLRQFSILLVCTIPSLGLSQISVYDAAVRLEADARSGASFSPKVFTDNAVGPQQTYFRQIDAFASSTLTVPTSTVHSWSNVSWNCSMWDLDVGLEACWESFDFGAPNSGHMLSRLTLNIRLTTMNTISTVGAFDPSNSTAAIEMLVGSTWLPLVSSTQIATYTGTWQPGDYRLKAQRLYNPVGNSTGCVPLNFHLHAQPVPEPSTTLALITGVTVLVRRRKSRQV